MQTQKFGYMGRICRIDLTTRQVTYEFPDDSVVRKYIGGNGFGVYYLYKEVPPGVEWSDPENRIMLMTGPLTGSAGPTAGYSIVTKGPLTNGAGASQAQGMLGPRLKFNGLDGLIIQGASPEPVYLHVHDEIVEIKDAKHLVGQDTWETTESIEQELGKTEKDLSVLSIGPAGENFVRLACIVSDRGHVAAHNGMGAVLGAKKLKAIAVERGSKRPALADKTAYNSLMRDLIKKAKELTGVYQWGTAKSMQMWDELNRLPIKNYTESDGRPYYVLERQHYMDKFEMKHVPCWGCPAKHCHEIKIKEGPYKGYVGEEMEYEIMAAFGSIIGNTDAASATVLGNMCDKLGIDGNEGGYLIGWLMECYEKGYISAEFLDGIELNWGNTEGAAKLIEKIAYRQGVGNKLAEGIMRAATQLGGEAQDCAIYTKKGNACRGHDHRAMFNMVLDTATGCSGTDDLAVVMPTAASVGLPAEVQVNTPDGVAAVLAGVSKLGVRALLDSMMLCSLATAGFTQGHFAQLISLATGWDFTPEEASKYALRVNNLQRAFAFRHGNTKEMEEPSKRYGGTIPKGPEAGRALYPDWDNARDDYYRHRGWDVETGKPLPDTLKEIGLEDVINDIWG